MLNPKNTEPVLNPSPGSGNGAATSQQPIEVKPSRTSRTTGPRTSLGKERTKRNAVKHGILSQVALLKDESRAEFAALLKGFRENLQPEGRLEEVLVEKLALSAWRLRRLIVAETAEIRKATEFLDWDAVARRDRANDLLEEGAGYRGGLIRHTANPDALERCLELLKELSNAIAGDGFDYESDTEILRKLYGEFSSEKLQQTLFNSYQEWSLTAECSEEERQQNGYASSEDCKKHFLADLTAEIKRLERYKQAHAEKMKLEVLRQRVPLTPQFDHLLRYEASLERNFDRTLSQLERLQRMRQGQPVPPKLEVHHSLS